jgi:hypothetical protein
MAKASGHIGGTFFNHASLHHASLRPDEYTALLGSIGLEVVAHTVEDWQSGGGRTVWRTRAFTLQAS